MKAFFDESGKHEAATVISMAGLLMSADTCKELQRRWLYEAAKPPRIPLPFHMSDCVVGSKNFKYLKDDESRRLQMQRRMIEAMRGLDMQAYTASVIRGEYALLADCLRHNRVFRDPWFLVFESAIQEMMFGSAESGKNHRISLVFDRQDEFKMGALALHSELLEIDHPKSHRLGGLTFEAKNKFAALQAIDVIVYEANRHVIDCRLGGQPERWQSALIHECINVTGRIYDREGLQRLCDLVAAERAGTPE